MKTIHVKTIAQSHQALGIAKPKHPLFSIIRFEDLNQYTNDQRVRLIFDFYQIVLKRNCPGKIQYGQTQYDFDEGVMSYFAPKQVSIVEPGMIFPNEGWLLNIHPDFIRNTTLDKKIKSYGFFEYAANEALIMSQDEEKSIVNIFEQIETEYKLAIDSFSQDVVVANIELLLTYSNRYYIRQFALRKPNHQGLLIKFDAVLSEYFDTSLHGNGLPTVKQIAEKLNISPHYLSDMLRQLTGQNTQQHIHEKLIEKAKEKLTTTELSVSEIAFQLGFEYSQSFSKLFKSKTSVSPVEYRHAFN